jgi:hypothetical protein
MRAVLCSAIFATAVVVCGCSAMPERVTGDGSRTAPVPKNPGTTEVPESLANRISKLCGILRLYSIRELQALVQVNTISMEDCPGWGETSGKLFSIGRPAIPFLAELLKHNGDSEHDHEAAIAAVGIINGILDEQPFLTWSDLEPIGLWLEWWEENGKDFRCVPTEDDALIVACPSSTDRAFLILPLRKHVVKGDTFRVFRGDTFLGLVEAEWNVEEGFCDYVQDWGVVLPIKRTRVQVKCLGWEHSGSFNKLEIVEPVGGWHSERAQRQPIEFESSQHKNGNE